MPVIWVGRPQNWLRRLLSTRTYLMYLVSGAGGMGGILCVSVMRMVAPSAGSRCMRVATL